jgi:hypothetical protein
VQYVAIVCRAMIGVMFAVSVGTKAAGPAAFAAFTRSLRRMRLLPPRLVRPVARTVVAAELAIPLSLAIPVAATAVVGFAVAAALLAAFAVAIVLSIRGGTRTPCRCFGRSTVELGAMHVWRNVVLVCVSVLGLIATRTGGPAGTAGVAVAVVGGLVGGGLVTVLDDIAGLFRPAAPATSHEV